jgi:hypothetical protein
LTSPLGPALLELIQEHLEAIYGFRCEHRAQDYLVDEASAKALGGSGGCREQLLVSEGEQGLELALYLAPPLLARVAAAGPSAAVDEDLGAFCEVAEGVSHFVYLARSAALDRRVSLLELEAQAEVDKFAVCVLLRWGAAAGGWATGLVGSLFDRARLRDGLSAEERHRYRESSRVARAYCRRLLPLVGSGCLDRVLGELRHAYRLGAEAKLDYFARAP